MIFNSLDFLYFVALFIPVYFLLKGKARLLWALSGSYFFYGCWDWRFLMLIGISTFIDYMLGAALRDRELLSQKDTWLKVGGMGLATAVGALGANALAQSSIEYFQSDKIIEAWYLPTIGIWSAFLVAYFADRFSTENNRDKRLLWVSMLLNLGFLAFFKYFNFFADSFATLIQSMGMEPSWNTLNIILPVGISFYTFQSMSYTIDIYRKQLEPELDFVKFATFVAFWPQLVAGPIVRASDFLPQFQKDHDFKWDRLINGTTQILWGFFKKVAVADSLAPIIDQCYANPDNYASIYLLIGVIFYSFQIYCDFSGYSDIAIGFARILGFDFPQNFRTPYFSQGFSEFWRRWHISLSSWLRDYLYISLGGNRGGKFNTYRNLMLTMLLGGLWHGAGWAFVFWGFLHGMYLVVERFVGKPFGKFMRGLYFPKWLQIGVNVALVYFFTNLAWIYFRAPNFSVATDVISGIASFKGFSFVNVMNKFQVLSGAMVIGILLLVEFTDLKYNWGKIAFEKPAFRVVGYAVLLWLIAFFGTFGSSAFIYFQF